MTAVLTTGVVLALALTIFNLILLFAVIRKLRDGAASIHPGDAGLPAVGTRVGQFRAETTDGAQSTDADLAAGRSVIGFLSPSCAPCQEVIEELTAARPAPETRMAFYVAGDGGEETTTVVARLHGHGTVAVIGGDDEVARAFGGVSGYPTLVRVENGVVAAAGRRLADVLQPTSLAGVLASGQR